MTDFRNPAALAALARGDISNALVAATPGGIERQEAEGQLAMASSFKTLPKDMDDTVARALGFKYLGTGNELFSDVEAPAGWTIRPTNHAMHSDILDDQGRVRGSIFYKAAFYDQRASGGWHTRYRIDRDYDGNYDPITVKAVDTVTGKSLFTGTVPAGELPSWERAKGAENAAVAYLDANFPEWKNPTSYW